MEKWSAPKTNIRKYSRLKVEARLRRFANIFAFQQTSFSKYCKSNKQSKDKQKDKGDIYTVIMKLKCERIVHLSIINLRPGMRSVIYANKLIPYVLNINLRTFATLVAWKILSLSVGWSEQKYTRLKISPLMTIWTSKGRNLQPFLNGKVSRCSPGKLEKQVQECLAAAKENAPSA